MSLSWDVRSLGRARRRALAVAGRAAAGGRFGDLAFFDELFEFRAALDEFERALFLHDLGGVAGEVAALAHRPDETCALHAPAEFPDGRERILGARLADLCINAHVAALYHGAYEITIFPTPRESTAFLKAESRKLFYACASVLNPVTRWRLR